MLATDRQCQCAGHGLHGQVWHQGHYRRGRRAWGRHRQVVYAYRDALARHGRETELGTDLIIGHSLHIAETEQKAIEEARPYFEENMKMFGPLGFVRGLTDAQIAALADPRRARSAGLPTLEQAVAAGSWLVGPPEADY